MKNTHCEIGVILTNVGTPTAPTSASVRQFLDEFLWDPRVVKMPRYLWWIILKGIILPFRPKHTAKAYQAIWTEEGSPLLVISKQQQAKLQNYLGESYKVLLGMRYGKPSIENALHELERANIQNIVLLPLYPQYSATTTVSVFDALSQVLQSQPMLPEIHFINHYADNEKYIDALVKSIKNHWQQQSQQRHLLFSFHGIPQSYVANGDPYKEECYLTVKEVTRKLNLLDFQWTIAFQSRFGSKKWLEPYCDEILAKFPKNGVKQIDIICPGFATDCLETLEEIAIRNKHLFLKAGGEVFNYIPCLNASDQHIEMMAELIKNRHP